MEAKRVLSHVCSLFVVSYQATHLFCWAFICMLSYPPWFCVSRGKACPAEFWALVTGVDPGLSCPFPSLSTPEGDEGPHTKANLQSSLSEFGHLYCFNNFAVLFFFWMIETPWVGRKVETGIQDYWLESLCK